MSRPIPSSSPRTCNEAENWKENRWGFFKKSPTGETHYALSIIQADDNWDLEHNGRGDSSDLYPGTMNVTRFGGNTFPNSTTYYLYPEQKPMFGYSGVTVENISEVGGVITADLSFQDTVGKVPTK